MATSLPKAADDKPAYNLPSQGDFRNEDGIYFSLFKVHSVSCIYTSICPARDAVEGHGVHPSLSVPHRINNPLLFFRSVNMEHLAERITARSWSDSFSSIQHIHSALGCRTSRKYPLRIRKYEKERIGHVQFFQQSRRFTWGGAVSEIPAVSSGLEKASPFSVLSAI